MKTMAGKDMKFVTRKTNQNDSMDVPFTILGHKLRWISARSNEDKLTRPWKVLKKSELPKEIVEDLERRSVNIFRDGETIRYGTCVLAFATDEAVTDARSRVQADTQSQLRSIGMDTEKRPGVRHDARDTEVKRVGPSEFND